MCGRRSWDVDSQGPPSVDPLRLSSTNVDDVECFLQFLGLTIKGTVLSDLQVLTN